MTSSANTPRQRERSAAYRTALAAVRDARSLLREALDDLDTQTSSKQNTTRFVIRHRNPGALLRYLRAAGLCVTGSALSGEYYGDRYELTFYGATFSSIAAVAAGHSAELRAEAERRAARELSRREAEALKCW